MRYCRRRIDRTLKKLDFSDAKSVSALASDYEEKTTALDVHELAKSLTKNLENAISDRDVAELLKWYDNKGMLGIACKAKGTTKTQFEQWIVRALRNGSAPLVFEAVRSVLPSLKAQ
jgi:hypothetical protein